MYRIGPLHALPWKLPKLTFIGMYTPALCV